MYFSKMLIHCILLCHEHYKILKFACYLHHLCTYLGWRQINVNYILTNTFIISRWHRPLFCHRCIFAMLFTFLTCLFMAQQACGLFSLTVWTLVATLCVDLVRQMYILSAFPWLFLQILNLQSPAGEENELYSVTSKALHNSLFYLKDTLFFTASSGSNSAIK